MSKNPRKVHYPRGAPLDLDQIETLASRGLTVDAIAKAIGISDRQLYQRKRLNSEISDAFARGRAKGESVVANALFEQCRAGNVQAMKLYLACRCGWKETQIIEQTGKDGGPIEIDVSGARERLMQKLLADG